MPPTTVFSHDPTAATKAAASYQAGESLRKLAAHWGVSYGKIRLVLLAEGVEMRPRGGARPRPPGTP